MTATVFLDTVGLIAVWDVDDQWHQEASKAFERIQEEQLLSITTSFVMIEFGNAAARKPFRDDVGQLRDELEKAGQLIHPTEQEWLSAWEAYRRGDGANAGIVDQISFILIRRLGMNRAFTNDKHFQAAGFEILF